MKGYIETEIISNNRKNFQHRLIFEVKIGFLEAKGRTLHITELRLQLFVDFHEARDDEKFPAVLK